MFFNKRQIIGLDIGASRAKAVLLEQGKADGSMAVRDYAPAVNATRVAGFSKEEEALSR